MRRRANQLRKTGVLSSHLIVEYESLDEPMYRILKGIRELELARYWSKYKKAGMPYGDTEESLGLWLTKSQKKRHKRYERPSYSD